MLKKNISGLLAWFFASVFFTMHSFYLDNVTPTKHSNSQTTTLEPCNFFSPSSLSTKSSCIITDPLRLLQAAKDSLHYLEIHNRYRLQVADPTPFKDLISYARTKETLRFVISTIEEDKITGKFRILDPAFLKKNFGSLNWNADWHSANKHNIPLPHDGKIRLTSYAVLTVNGNNKKTANYPCALYQLRDKSIQHTYTKHNILSGVLEKKENKATCKALAWLSRQGLEDALMHGTVLVKFTNGSSKLFNVDSNNGIAYDRNQKNVLAQKRYWFFRELKSSNKSPEQLLSRIKKRKDVIFAGDLKHIGLGKLMALSYDNPITKKPELRLGILADTGGAFIDNLYQLDFFRGIVASHNELKKAIRRLPTFVRANVLYKK